MCGTFTIHLATCHVVCLDVLSSTSSMHHRSISQTVRKSPIQRLDSVSRVWGTETMATPASRAISAAAKFFVWVMWLSTMNTSLLLRWFNKIYEMSQPSNKSFIGHSAFATESPPFVSSIFTFFRLYITIGTKFM